MKYYNKKKQFCIYLHSLTKKEVHLLKTDLYFRLQALERIKPQGIMTKKVINEQIQIIASFIRLASAFLLRKQIDR